MNFRGPYDDYRQKRVDAIVNYFGIDWFKNKKILELGCGFAHISNEFYKLGAQVIASDARIEHLNNANSLFPDVKTVLCDLDNDWKFNEHFDLIINIGLLYHLKNYEQLLCNCSKHCDNMFLELITSDSDDDTFVTFFEENGLDQAFNGIGCRPSEKNIEKILMNNNFTFERYFKSELNSGWVAKVDWEIKNTQKCFTSSSEHSFIWLRRAWFCKTNR